MEYLNLKRSELEGETVQDASHEARSVWLSLMSYCAGQENGGRIEGAKGWSDRKWMKQASLSLGDVQVESALWTWEGEDLMVEFYPAEQEAVLRKKRRGGSIGGKKRAENLRNFEGKAEGELQGVLEGKAEGELQGVLEGKAEGELQRKGKEGKEKEGKVREAPPLSDACIPTETEVRTWAEMSGVEPEFAAQKFRAASETHAWVRNGHLIDWRLRFKRFWEEDREQWTRKNLKNGAAPNAAALESDQGWWWTEDRSLVEKTLVGALMAGDEITSGRLREILRIRTA